MRPSIRLAVWLSLGIVALCVPVQGAILDLGVPDQFEAAICEAAGAFVEDTGHQVRLHLVPVPPGAFELAREGNMDVLIPPCNHSAEVFCESGWASPETGKRIFCRRMAIILPPKNPKALSRLSDILKPDVKVASLTVLRSRIEEVAPSLCADAHESLDIMAMWLGNGDLMMDLLATDNVDAVLAWDTFAADDPRNFVVIRLPRSVAGDQACAPITAFVTPESDEPEAAQQLVDFLSEGLAAEDIFLKHGYMTDDGSDAASYDEKAAPRFEKVYENICQQVIDDYGIVEGVALDIGCGPGQMTQALAGMTNLEVTGLDIEPEVIEIAQRHAAEAGLSSRLHFICADAHSLPFPQDYADLIISRGTLPFLRDQVLALREVYRVLKPGGVAFLGGGMGRYTPLEEARKLYPKGVVPGRAMDWGSGQSREDSIFPFPVRSFEVLVAKAGLSNCTVVNEGGRWVEMRK
ncbi:MAG: methyltransferase domain-containing protein [Armatimonadota bacterium]|nr:MAG: methyltransferase domain-containing protein [Armatimonadota bacterium]